MWNLQKCEKGETIDADAESKGEDGRTWDIRGNNGERTEDEPCNVLQKNEE